MASEAALQLLALPASQIQIRRHTARAMDGNDWDADRYAEEEAMMAHEISAAEAEEEALGRRERVECLSCQVRQAKPPRTASCNALEPELLRVRSSSVRRTPKPQAVAGSRAGFVTAAGPVAQFSVAGQLVGLGPTVAGAVEQACPDRGKRFRCRT